MNSQVLVTGASGFIAQQTILDLLEQGYRVRGTLRSLDKAEFLRDSLRRHTPMADMLECVEANLDADKGWTEAAQGCDYVLHIASPVPITPPKNAEDVIRPAREGTLRVLKAAHAAGVKRVVMTSSVAAITYGWTTEKPDVFTEEHWSNPDALNGNTTYARSKTLAERAAWDFVNSPEGAGLELAAINPAMVLGPALSPDVSPSLQLITQLMGKKLPALPRLAFAIIDVRDVAAAHIRAMTTPQAAGKRFILADKTIWAHELADILRQAFPDRAKSIPTRYIPDLVVRLMALFNPTLKQVTQNLGECRRFSHEQLETLLGITPISAEDAAISSAKSMIELGLI